MKIKCILALLVLLVAGSAFGVDNYLTLIYQYQGTVKWYDQATDTIRPDKYLAYFVPVSETTCTLVWYWGSGSSKRYAIEQNADVIAASLVGRTRDKNAVFIGWDSDVGLGTFKMDKLGSLSSFMIKGSYIWPTLNAWEYGSIKVKYNKTMTRAAIKAGMPALDYIVMSLQRKGYVAN